WRDGVPERKPRRGARPRRVLPFRFREQPVRLAGLAAQPFHIGLRIEPRDIDDRTVAPSPALVIRPEAPAAALSRTGVPFLEGHLEPADGERLCDRHAVLGFRLPLGGRRSHGELAGRYDNHPRTNGAVPELGPRLRLRECMTGGTE